MRVVASWSGGKESCFACHKAMSEGFEVSHLLNLISEERRCRGHGLDSELIRAQSHATGIPIVQKKVAWDTYEQEFKKTICELKRVGIRGAVFGDVDLQGHKNWVDGVCKELGIKAIEPLWGADPERILVDFINEGFEAIVVRAKADLFDKEWLGSKIDEDFVRELHKLKNKTNFNMLGEAGEYHTFVASGPIFKRRIRILESDKVLKDGYWSLNILKWKLTQSSLFEY